MKSINLNKTKTLKLIFLFGIISLLGDVIYEGARGVNGPYLEILGANAAIIGFVAGVGEFLGYSIRFVSGYFSDKMKAYWFFTMVGYGLLFTVPLLSLPYSLSPNGWERPSVHQQKTQFCLKRRNASALEWDLPL